MKKKVFALLLLVLLFASIPLFATEIILSPNVGMSVYSAYGLHEISNPHDTFRSEISKQVVTYTMPVPSIGLDMHFTHEGNGFTFSLINNAGLLMTFYKKGGFGDDKRDIIGFIWDGQILAGYTYGVKQPLSVRFGIGSGFALGIFTARSKNAHILNPFAIPGLLALHLDIQYAFTEHFGISAGIRDMLGFSGVLLDDEALNRTEKGITKSTINGFGNVFTLKLGIVFRF